MVKSLENHLSLINQFSTYITFESLCVCTLGWGHEEGLGRETERHRDTDFFSRPRLFSLGHISQFTCKLIWKSVSKQAQRKEYLKQSVLFSLSLSSSFCFFFFFFLFYPVTRLKQWWFRHNSYFWWAPFNYLKSGKKCVYSTIVLLPNKNKVKQGPFKIERIPFEIMFMRIF